MNQNRIRRDLDRLGSLIGGKTASSTRSPEPKRYRKLADNLKGQLVTSRAGSFCLVTTDHLWSYAQGNIELGRLQGRNTVPASAFSVKDNDQAIDTRSLLFLDTETTGLGGAGTVPFLIGVGSLSDTGLQVRQYLIPDYSDETAMLEALLEEFPPSTVLVTFNGAAFDLPLLKDRLIVNRVARDIPQAGHLDLLHSARRLFRRRLRDCTLTNLERELFDFHRQDDIPGYLVPSVYFEWLSSERTEGLASVLEHNRLDIVTLGFLVAYLADIFESRGDSLDRVDDLHSLSKLYRKRRQDGPVVELNARVDEIARGDLPDDVTLFHAQTFKRSGEWKRAVPLWEVLSSSTSREGFLACRELAMYYEHRVHDYQQALHYAQTAHRLIDLTPRQTALMLKRINRLRSRP